MPRFLRAVKFQNNHQTSKFFPFHAAISVDSNIEELEEIGMKEGWLVKICDRGGFHVVEFWIENKLMLELLTPEFTHEYLDFFPTLATVE
ncbi:MAG: hypothetical protein QNJ36_00390 [Calothrix sp. MO_167.B42]|nr:hypothetical protein [Calothrix sp. MO_167.B42]